MKYYEILNAYNDAERACYESTMEQIRTLKDKLSAAQDEFDARRISTQAIVDTLKKFGLEVSHVAGNSVYAKPIPGGKFRFIEFKYYTVRGDSSNHRRREARAVTLSKALSKATGLKVEVNQFSLEIDKPEKADSKSVIITVWV